jgi:hypothetical protein
VSKQALSTWPTYKVEVAGPEVTQLDFGTEIFPTLTDQVAPKPLFGFRQGPGAHDTKSYPSLTSTTISLPTTTATRIKDKQQQQRERPTEDAFPALQGVIAASPSVSAQATSMPVSKPLLSSNLTKTKKGKTIYRLS